MELLGIETGVNLEKLNEASKYIRTHLNRPNLEWDLWDIKIFYQG